MLACAALGCGAQQGPCDGMIDVGESCDDGNDDRFDGCDCTSEPAWTPPLGGRADDGLVVLEDDGAWCWFQDERAVFAGDRLVVSSVSHAGDIQVSSFDLATGARDHGVLRRRLERDDHDAASLLVRPDGRLTAFYTRHDGFPSLYWRTQVGDQLSIWDAEQELTIDDDITYSNPFWLPSEGRGTPRLYLWFRGLEYNPTVALSDDLGTTWSEPQQVLRSHTYGLAVQRPYVKYASNGTDTIHLLYTDGHPAELDKTNLYHLVYSNGELRRSDGSLAGSLRGDEDPKLPPAAGTLVHDGNESTAWVWDVALDRDARPVVVYAAYSDVATYRYARWDGARWQRHTIAFAGTPLYREQPFYAGGIALDPDDPSIVYFSSNADPRTGSLTGGHHELYRGITRDGGASWEVTSVTRNSTVDNIRPVVPANHPTATAVVWMQGTYQSYYEYDTRLVALLAEAGAEVAPQIEARGPAALARFSVNVDQRRDDDAVVVSLADLAPLTQYTVRLHTGRVDERAPMVWLRPGSELDVCTKHDVVAAHRPGNSATGADAYVDLAVTSDAAGNVELVGVGLDDRVVKPGSVDVFAQPATAPAAGVMVRITSDRPQRADETATVGRDRLVIDVEGLCPGVTYAITVRTSATASCDRAASRWRVDEADHAPRVVRSFELAGGAFTFQHVAAGSQLRLTASDVPYRLSTNPSEIAVEDIVLEEVVP
jgi:hypothetical protein